MTGTALDRLAGALGGSPEALFRAPGRANIIGEHTDYNGGLVLPVALEMSTYVGGRFLSEPVVRLRSADLNEDFEAPLDADPRRIEGWGRYVAAVARSLDEAGVPRRGFEGVVASDVPLGSGLSSSAALEVAVALSLSEAELDPLAVARICRRAENEFVGVRSGIMDQLTSSAGRAGSALLIDCGCESFDYVTFPENLTVLLVDSGVSHDNSAGDYNARREQCMQAARVLAVPHLACATEELISERSPELREVLVRRARHVVTEHARVRQAADALKRDDRSRLAATLHRSHESYARDFEASTPEIDALIEIAYETDGVVGARLTGGGFGGCTVNLVEKAAAQEAAKEVTRRYWERTGIEARWWLTAPSPGAERMPV
jgi:galactokinase